MLCLFGESAGEGTAGAGLGMASLQLGVTGVAYGLPTGEERRSLSPPRQHPNRQQSDTKSGLRRVGGVGTVSGPYCELGSLHAAAS